jgi:hypothetical protein
LEDEEEGVEGGVEGGVAEAEVDAVVAAVHSVPRTVANQRRMIFQSIFRTGAYKIKNLNLDQD